LSNKNNRAGVVLAASGHRRCFAAGVSAVTLRELVGFNIFLQIFDGVASYFILASGVRELNPLIGATIDVWGLPCALVSWKIFTCALLVIIYWLGRYKPMLSLGGLRFVGVVYSALGFYLAAQLFYLA
jgi:Domain of unknown function (DUF5658)